MLLVCVGPWAMPLAVISLDCIVSKIINVSKISLTYTQRHNMNTQAQTTTPNYIAVS